MSVRVISAVFAASQHSGTDLVMLLALADVSDDDDRSYPAVATLARKCRIQPRNANYVIKALQASGELRVLQNEGPRGTNLYRIMLAQLGIAKPLQGTAALQCFAPLQCSAPPPATQCAKPLQHSADEPSLNRQEPSVTPTPSSSVAPTRKAPLIPSCPYDTILALYNEVLPTMPAARTKTESREKAMAKRWKWIFTDPKTDGTRRATTESDALAWMRSYFERAQKNDFLMGRTSRSAEHTNWRCDLDFLLSDKGLVQVIEKTVESTA